MNKLRAYEVPSGTSSIRWRLTQGFGFAADLRDYALPAAIIRYFGVKQVRLLSNNPEKVAALEERRHRSG